MLLFVENEYEREREREIPDFPILYSYWELKGKRWCSGKNFTVGKSTNQKEIVKKSNKTLLSLNTQYWCFIYWQTK